MNAIIPRMNLSYVEEYGSQALANRNSFWQDTQHRQFQCSTRGQRVFSSQRVRTLPLWYCPVTIPHNRALLAA